MKTDLTIVALGNSITEAEAGMPDAEQRWLQVLAGLLKQEFPARSFKLVNSGIGGNSAREAMARLDRDVLAHQPDFVLLEFGGNNSGFRNRERRVSLAEFRRHLEDFRLAIAESTEAGVIVITFPPIVEEWHSVYTCGDNTGVYFEFFSAEGGCDAFIEQYREITRAFARNNGFALVDFAKKLKELHEKDSPGRYTLPDGVHLTVDGNLVLARSVFRQLRALV